MNKPWYLKESEKRKGHPLSRVPEWDDLLYESAHIMRCRLEEVLMAYDKLHEKLEEYKHWLQELT